MGRLDTKRQLQQARARRVRNVVRGTTERPRLSIHISNTSIHVQAIDDSTHKTLVGHKSKPGQVNIAAASELAKTFAASAKKAKVTKLVVDRGSKRYHGRLKAFVEGLRTEGLEL